MRYRCISSESIESERVSGTTERSIETKANGHMQMNCSDCHNLLLQGAFGSVQANQASKLIFAVLWVEELIFTRFHELSVSTNG